MIGSSEVTEKCCEFVEDNAIDEEQTSCVVGPGRIIKVTAL